MVEKVATRLGSKMAFLHDYVKANNDSSVRFYPVNVSFESTSELIAKTFRFFQFCSVNL